MDYKTKYLKYKNKYLDLKNTDKLIGGGDPSKMYNKIKKMVEQRDRDGRLVHGAPVRLMFDGSRTRIVKGITYNDIYKFSASVRYNYFEKKISVEKINNENIDKNYPIRGYYDPDGNKDFMKEILISTYSFFITDPTQAWTITDPMQSMTSASKKFLSTINENSPIDIELEIETLEEENSITFTNPNNKSKLKYFRIDLRDPKIQIRKTGTTEFINKIKTNFTVNEHYDVITSEIEGDIILLKNAELKSLEYIFYSDNDAFRKNAKVGKWN